MAEIIKESVTTQQNGPRAAVVTETKNIASKTQTVEYVLYFIYGLLVALLAFRFVFKLTGASRASGFVEFIYSITNVLVMPFEGIFRRVTTEGVETTAVFEASTLIAILVYGLVTWGFVQLIRIMSREKQESV